MATPIPRLGRVHDSTDLSERTLERARRQGEKTGEQLAYIKVQEIIDDVTREFAVAPAPIKEIRYRVKKALEQIK